MPKPVKPIALLQGKQLLEQEAIAVLENQIRDQIITLKAGNCSNVFIDVVYLILIQLSTIGTIAGKKPIHQLAGAAILAMDKAVALAADRQQYAISPSTDQLKAIDKALLGFIELLPKLNKRIYLQSRYIAEEAYKEQMTKTDLALPPAVVASELDTGFYMLQDSANLSVPPLLSRLYYFEDSDGVLHHGFGTGPWDALNQFKQFTPVDELPKTVKLLPVYFETDESVIVGNVTELPDGFYLLHTLGSDEQSYVYIKAFTVDNVDHKVALFGDWEGGGCVDVENLPASITITKQQLTSMSDWMTQI
jgi:hypothetical protein